MIVEEKLATDRLKETGERPFQAEGRGMRNGACSGNYKYGQSTKCEVLVAEVGLPEHEIE